MTATGDSDICTCLHKPLVFFRQLKFMYSDYSIVNPHLRKKIRSRYIISEVRYLVLLTQESKGSLGTLRKQKAIHQSYAGLSPHRLGYLNISETVGSLGGAALLEDVYHLGWALRVRRLTTLAAHPLCLWLMMCSLGFYYHACCCCHTTPPR